MLHCSYCGSEIPEDARFCGNCGRTPSYPQEGQTRINSLHRIGLEPVADNVVAPVSQPGMPVSPHWGYAPGQDMSDGATMPLDEDEERRRRAAMLGMGLLLAGEAQAGGSNVPMVHGTPQIGNVPTVSNTPPVHGSLGGGNLPGGGWQASGNIPHAPGYTPSMPSIHPPTLTPPPHQPQNPPQSPHPPHGNPAPAPKGCAPTILIVAILIPVLILGSIVTLGFTVFAPGLSLSGGSSVASGGTLTINGSHFLPGSSITLTLDNSLPLSVLTQQKARQLASVEQSRHMQGMADAQLFELSSASNTINANGDGTFSITITVNPSWSIGKHTIQASEGISHRSAQISFTITSNTVTPTPTTTGTSTGTPTGTVTPTVTPSVTTTPTVSPAAGPPSLSCVNPTSIAFGPVSDHYTQAISAPITLCSQGTGGLNWTASWNQAAAPWLALDQTSGTITAPGQAQIHASANASQLAAGNYSATITFASPSSNVTQSLSITLTVQAGCIKGAPSLLNYSAILHVSEAGPQMVSLTNCGAIGRWSASAKTSDGANWLSANPTGGTLGAGAPLNVTVSASTLNSTLKPGSYTGAVTFAIGAGTFVVNVNFTVQAAPILSTNNVTLLIGSQECGSGTSGFYVCYVSLTNTSQTLSLTWSYTLNLLPGSTVKPAGGTLAAGQTIRVQISIPTSDCTRGANITFAGPGNSVIVSWECFVPIG